MYVLVALLAFVLLVGVQARSAYHSEPQWERQWHLHDASESDEYWIRTGRVGDHLGVQTVWNRFNITGAGIRIAIVDDGVDVFHNEFRDKWDQSLAWDYNDNDDMPAPRVHDSHGTESAGVATAHLNGVCGVGTAPGATLVPIRLIATPVTDLVESQGLSHRYDKIDIYSNSWGPPDDGQRLDAPGPTTAAAMYTAVSRGRGGRGVVYVWAGGNGRQWLDSCSYDGFANSRLVSAVAAVDYFGQATYYGEWCPALLVSAPSSGINGPVEKQRIATTQPHGRFGQSAADCTTDFGGTSASAPMVAGVVALMLEARPELGWRDVQHVLAFSARRNDPDHVSWKQNGAGHWYSEAYGFGQVNATAAVVLSRQWTLLDDERYVSLRTQAGEWRELGNFALAPAEQFQFDLSPDSDGEVEFVDVYLTVEHPRRGDLEVWLESPTGTRSQLALPHNDDNANYNRWRFGSRSSTSERAAGTWTVGVRDVVPNRASGAVTEVELRVWMH